jgi:hypothetical protein
MNEGELRWWTIRNYDAAYTLFLLYRKRSVRLHVPHGRKMPRRRVSVRFFTVCDDEDGGDVSPR